MSVLFDARPIRAAMAGWLLLGIGGLVCLPLALANRALWLALLALPLLLAGGLLLATRLRIQMERRSGVIHATYRLLGLALRQRSYSPSDRVGLELTRVAGDARERPSDTWYLRLRFHTGSYLVGKYDDRLAALEAQRRLSEALLARPSAEVASASFASAQDGLRAVEQSAVVHYRVGLAALRAGNLDEARGAFEEARRLAQEPLLRRMIEQRLHELERRHRPLGS